MICNMSAAERSRPAVERGRAQFGFLFDLVVLTKTIAEFGNHSTAWHFSRSSA